MINGEADEVIEGLFKSLLNRYQNNLEKSMKGSEFVFHQLLLMFCMVKKKKYILLLFQNITQIVKKKLLF